ncbi:D-tyrosyl-tRNA(Tyr) deacylase [Rhodotorula kratochvilovae]
MRCVLQRVKSASVTVDGEVISSIGRGILCLIGIGTHDSQFEADWLAGKLLALKVFPEDKDGEVWGWKNSVVEAGYEVLCVSQFTLQANLRKGAKPDFHAAKDPQVARQMYEDFVADLRRRYKADKIKDGQFQAMMDVQLVNDGPVTLVLDSATDAPAKPAPKAPLTEEQKQKQKEKLAARQRNRAQHSGGASGAETPSSAGAASTGVSTPASVPPTQEAPAQAQTAEKSEKDLIHEAEEKSRELAERFKVAMTESYP